MVVADELLEVDRWTVGGWEPKRLEAVTGGEDRRTRAATAGQLPGRSLVVGGSERRKAAAKGPPSVVRAGVGKKYKGRQRCCTRPRAIGDERRRSLDSLSVSAFNHFQRPTDLQ